MHYCTIMVGCWDISVKSISKVQIMYYPYMYCIMTWPAPCLTVNTFTSEIPDDISVWWGRQVMNFLFTQKSLTEVRAFQSAYNSISHWLMKTSNADCSCWLSHSFGVFKLSVCQTLLLNFWIQIFHAFYSTRASQLKGSQAKGEGVIHLSPLLYALFI